MILLLAFFIILQSLMSQQDEGLFRKGKGSFVRAIDTFGMGRFFASYGLMESGVMGHTYQQDSQADPAVKPAQDPERQAAREALERLRDEVDEASTRDEKWGATVFAPGTGEKQGDSLSKSQKLFFRTFAQKALPRLLRDGSVIGLGAAYPQKQDSERNMRALRKASKLGRAARRKVMSHVEDNIRDKARQFVYSFCRPESSQKDSKAIHLYVDVRKVKTKEKGVSQ
jgi:hypothetical protein